MKNTPVRWIVPGALAAITAIAFSTSGCNKPEPATENAPVAETSPVADATPAEAASPTEAGDKMSGPPLPPPGPKAPGDFDKKPFKGNGKVVKTASGLQYEDMTIGKGATAEPGKTCSMHYTGTLTDGTQFDSSRDRNEPFPFQLGAGQVIPGWDEGVAGMKVGGRRKLIIPYAQAYGEAGRPPTIPPKATLVFDVELMDVQ